MIYRQNSRGSPTKDKALVKELEHKQQQRRSLSPQKSSSPTKESPTRSMVHSSGVAKSDLNISRSIEASRNSRSLENLDHHGAVTHSYERSSNTILKQPKPSSKSKPDPNGSLDPVGSKQVSRRRSDKNNPDQSRNSTSDSRLDSNTQPRKSSSSSKKENRKSTPGAMTGNSSGAGHGSPSRQQLQGQPTEKSGSGGKRIQAPSGVGAVGGRGSILHNTVNPLLTELHQRYTHHHRPSPETQHSIEELRNAFELAERSSPGITEHFIQLIFSRLHPNGSEDRARSYVDRLTRVTKP